MRRLLVNLDNTLDEWLANEINQNETVRKALYLYKDDISTPDSMAALRRSYEKLTTYLKSKHKSYDESFRKLDKLIQELETRMQ